MTFRSHYSYNNKLHVIVFNHLNMIGSQFHDRFLVSIKVAYQGLAYISCDPKQNMGCTITYMFNRYFKKSPHDHHGNKHGYLLT